MGYVNGKNNFGECQKNGPEVEKEMDILESFEETGYISGIRSDILLKDQSMGRVEELGQDQNRGPEGNTNYDNMFNPIVISTVGECSEFGPPILDQEVSSETQLINKSISKWKWVGRGNTGYQNQLNLGVKLDKREAHISGEERKSDIKRFKESISDGEVVPSQQKMGDLIDLVGVENGTFVQEDMEARIRVNNDDSMVELGAQISAARFLPTSRTQ